MKFTLRTLFIWLTAIAIYFAIVFAVPFIASYICLILASFLMVPIIATGVAYDRAYARTFWIGCAASGVIPFLTIIYYSFAGGYLLILGDDGEEGRMICIVIAICHGLVLLSGGVAMAARWLIEMKNRSLRSKVAFDTSILHGRVTVSELHASRDRE